MHKYFTKSGRLLYWPREVVWKIVYRRGKLFGEPAWRAGCLSASESAPPATSKAIVTSGINALYQKREMKVKTVANLGCRE